jgi:hypothetical protein
MNFNLGSKETWTKIGDGVWRFSKHIVIKGIQQTVMETAGGATLAALEGDMNKAKHHLTFDGIVGPKKVKVDKPKKGWFGKKKDEAEEVLEEVKAETGAIEEVELDDAEVEVVDKKKK